MHGTFANMVQKKSKDARLEDEWKEANAHRPKRSSSASSWFPSSVSAGAGVQLRIVQRMLGPSRAQLQEYLGGVAPERCGIKLQDLINHEGTSYKGILVPDPNEKWLRFEVVKTFTYEKTEQRLPSDAHCDAEHPQRVFDYVVSTETEKDKIGGIFKKCKTQPHTLEDLLAKAKQWGGQEPQLCIID